MALRAPFAALALLAAASLVSQDRPRIRDLAPIGTGTPGAHNAITDVPGVRVGHATVRDGAARTGVTVVLPHDGNVYQQKVPAAVVVGNGYGKLAGSTQIEELGEIETPIALTNTLSVGTVMDALVADTLAQEGNERVRSVNAVVGETNDGYLNDIRGRHVQTVHVQQALAAARTEQGVGPVPMGCVGAGAGTVCFGFKGGIGTASRRIGEWHVGVLVQSNFGGRLTIAGVPMDDVRPKPRRRGERDDKPPVDDGSCMIVVATDAPLSARNLKRLARRALAGMARTGASFSNGSGDYVLAFSTAESLRVRPGDALTGAPTVANGRMTPLFVAAAEATEEAILDSLLQATSTEANGRTVEALPIDAVRARLRAAGR